MLVLRHCSIPLFVFCLSPAVKRFCCFLFSVTLRGITVLPRLICCQETCAVCACLFRTTYLTICIHLCPCHVARHANTHSSSQSYICDTMLCTCKHRLSLTLALVYSSITNRYVSIDVACNGCCVPVQGRKARSTVYTTTSVHHSFLHISSTVIYFLLYTPQCLLYIHKNMVLPCLLSSQEICSIPLSPCMIHFFYVFPQANLHKHQLTVTCVLLVNEELWQQRMVTFFLPVLYAKTWLQQGETVVEAYQFCFLSKVCVSCCKRTPVTAVYIKQKMYVLRRSKYFWIFIRIYFLTYILFNV